MDVIPSISPRNSISSTELTPFGQGLLAASFECGFSGLLAPSFKVGWLVDGRLLPASFK